MICCHYFIFDTYLSNLVSKRLLHEELQPSCYNTVGFHYPNCHSFFSYLTEMHRKAQPVFCAAIFQACKWITCHCQTLLKQKIVIFVPFQISSISSISYHFHCSPWMLPNMSTASIKEWCPNCRSPGILLMLTTDYTILRTDCSLAYISHVVIWCFFLITVTITLQALFYFVSHKLLPIEHLSEELHMLHLQCQWFLPNDCLCHYPKSDWSQHHYTF